MNDRLSGSGSDSRSIGSYGRDAAASADANRLRGRRMRPSIPEPSRRQLTLNYLQLKEINVPKRVVGRTAQFAWQIHDDGPPVSPSPPIRKFRSTRVRCGAPVDSRAAMQSTSYGTQTQRKKSSE